MAFDLAVIAEHVAAMRDNLPVTTSIGTGFRMRLMDSRRMELYGTGTDYQFSVGYVVSSLGSVPDTGDKVTVDGTVFRVIGHEYDPSRVSVRIDLGEEYV